MNNTVDHSLAYLEHLISITNNAVTIIDVEGKVLFWNKTAETFYDIPSRSIIGKNIRHFFHPDDLMVLKVLETKQVVHSLYHRPRPDTHVLVNSTPVFGQEGELLGAISVEQDISQLVKLNEELTETSLALDSLKTEVNREKGDPFSQIKGQSKAIKRSIELAKKVAVTDATVLITGESGVGKEVFARAIHAASLRRENNFIPINCGAIPSALFESELFGYEAGAFTGAAKQGKAGKLEIANNGTLFLDEIGELPLEMQVKLLRALQEQAFYPVGGTKAKRVNVRIIAATNRDLEQRVAEGRFREDLYYRLNVVNLHVPTLKERREDIPELISIFLKECASKYQKPLPSMNHDVLTLLMQYDWPGNIRQLKNVIERLTILADQEFKVGDLPHYIRQANLKTEPLSPNPPLQEEKELLERDRILKALQETYGNKSAAARKLGISRAGLYQKLKKWKI